MIPIPGLTGTNNVYLLIYLLTNWLVAPMNTEAIRQLFLYGKEGKKTEGQACYPQEAGVCDRAVIIGRGWVARFARMGALPT